MNNKNTSSAVDVPSCPYCGCAPHNGGIGACPNVAEIEYYEDGRVKRVVKHSLTDGKSIFEQVFGKSKYEF